MVKGAFLLGDFEDNVTIYMEIPQGFKQWYRTDEVWLLLQTIYGTKQAAMAFWRLTSNEAPQIRVYSTNGRRRCKGIIVVESESYCT